MKTAAIIAPPPPEFSLVNQALSAFFLAALFLIAAPPAEAQTHTFTLSGPATIAEGESATYTITRTGPDEVGAGFLINRTYTAGTATADDFQGGNAPAAGANTQFTSTGVTASEVTFTIAIAQDTLKEPGETFTLGLAKIGSRDSEITIAPASATGLTVTILDDDTARALALTGPDTIAEDGSATYTVTLSGDAFYSTAAINWAATGDTADITPTSGSVTFATTDTAGAVMTFMLTVRDNNIGDGPRAFTIALADPGIANTVIGAALTVSITDDDDDPAAREARLEAPLASAGRGVGQLAAAAVQQRLTAGVGGAGANSLTIAGRSFAGAEALAAEVLAGGFTGDSAMELLRQSGFSVAGGDGGRGFNFWGSGGYVSAEGDHDGVEYDGDTSAFTLGIDTGWRDGLIGVAVASSDGDTDFTVTADGMKSTLETTVTSVHPYFTRRFNRSQLWLTAGHGSGDAELKEPDAVIKTDITVTTAAIGFTRAQTDRLSANLSALYTRAALDAAESAGRALPKTTADSWRVAASGQARWQRDAFSPFANFTVRHDSGDGDTGIAGDVGGGLEWRAPTVQIRLAGAASVAGSGTDEKSINLTARKTAGRLNLGVTVGIDHGVNTANLLSGEWKF